MGTRPYNGISVTIGHVEAPAHGVAQPPVLLKLWWLQPASSGLALIVIGIYAFWSALQGTGFEHGPYLSPFYSPVIQLGFWPLSPAFLSSALPLGFRATCYYYRKAYYRAWFWDPPACAAPDLGIPGRLHGRYVGETRFPWILLNSHRFFLYGALAILAILWYDTVRAFIFDGRFGIGLGSVLFLANVVLLSLYTASCHSLRHLVGGGTDCMSCSRPRYTAWRWLSATNPRHGYYAWTSLISVTAVDVYIRLLNAGVLADPRLF